MKIKLSKLLHNIKLHFIKQKEFYRTFDRYGIGSMPTDTEANLLMCHKIQSVEDRLGRYGKNFDGEGN
jgi:hypothetical protein